MIRHSITDFNHGVQWPLLSPGWTPCDFFPVKLPWNQEFTISAIPLSSSAIEAYSSWGELFLLYIQFTFCTQGGALLNFFVIGIPS